MGNGHGCGGRHGIVMVNGHSRCRGLVAGGGGVHFSSAKCLQYIWLVSVNAQMFNPSHLQNYLQNNSCAGVP